MVAILILTDVKFGDAFAHSGVTGIVKERIDYFKASQGNLKKIRAHISKENYDLIIPPANSIASWSARMSDYFPARSDTKPSEASPKIWADFEGFTATAQLNWNATLSLAKAAETGDWASVINAFRDTAEGYKSCHKTYRLK